MVFVKFIKELLMFVYHLDLSYFLQLKHLQGLNQKRVKGANVSFQMLAKSSVFIALIKKLNFEIICTLRILCVRKPCIL